MTDAGELSKTPRRGLFAWFRRAGDDRSSRLPGTALGKTLAGGVVVGAVILIPFAVEIHPSWSVLGAAAMFGAASMAAGGLLGLLFGVPRSVAGAGQPAADPTGTAASATLVGISANTNLEQISDWLTKIIVGVSLTQLVTIKRNAVHLFNAMAPSLGDAKAGTLAKAAAFAGAEVVYFSILGFFMGWLYARLRLGVLMSNTDALLSLAQRATKAGDTATADKAKAAAAANVQAATKPAPVAVAPVAPGGATTADSTAQPLASPVDLATQYDQLRTTLAPSAARTSQLEDVVRQARHLSDTQKFTVQDTRSMFLTGGEGSRVVALGIMQADVTCADLDSVLDAISNSKSAFEQYQALVVADLLTPTLSTTDQVRLRAALQTDTLTQQLATSTARRRLVELILPRLAETAPSSPAEPLPT